MSVIELFQLYENVLFSVHLGPFQYYHLLSWAETYLLVASDTLYVMSICLVVLLCSSKHCF